VRHRLRKSNRKFVESGLSGGDCVDISGGCGGGAICGAAGDAG
jgi:hypothetical protein